MAKSKANHVGMRSRAVCDLLSLPSSTLNYWVQIGLVRPRIRTPQGRRVEQYWTVEDIVTLKAIQQLRASGASLQQVRKAAALISQRGGSISNAKLYWDGSNILIKDEAGNYFSTVKEPRQLAWFLAGLPLGTWRRQVHERAEVIDVEAFRQRDRARKAKQAKRRRAVRTADLLTKEAQDSRPFG